MQQEPKWKRLGFGLALITIAALAAVVAFMHSHVTCVEKAVARAQAAGLVLDRSVTPVPLPTGSRPASDFRSVVDRMVRQRKVEAALDAIMARPQENDTDAPDPAFEQLVFTASAHLAALDSIEPSQGYVDQGRLLQPPGVRFELSSAFHRCTIRLLDADASIRSRNGDVAGAAVAVTRMMRIAAALRHEIGKHAQMLRMSALDRASDRILEQLAAQSDSSAFVNAVILDDGKDAWSRLCESELTAMLSWTRPDLVGLRTAPLPIDEVVRGSGSWFRDTIRRFTWPESMSRVLECAAQCLEASRTDDSAARETIGRLVAAFGESLQLEQPYLAQRHDLEHRIRAKLALARAAAFVLTEARREGFDVVDLDALAKHAPEDFWAHTPFVLQRDASGITLTSRTNAQITTTLKR